MSIQQMFLGGGGSPEKTATLSYPSGYDNFWDTTAVDLSESDLTTGIELDTNDSSASTIAYAGGYKLIIGPAAMTLEFHLWGSGSTAWDASSSTYYKNAAAGGYTKYVCTFTAGTEIGIYIGGFDPSNVCDDSVTSTVGWTAAQYGGWPDGGTAGTGAGHHGAGGGGSTRIGLIYTSTSLMNASTATYHAIAGGAGGTHMHMDYANGGGGGGTTGEDRAAGLYSSGGGGGGSQSAGGTGGVASSYGGAGDAGAKYQGGDGNAYSVYGGGGAGGGGYYGGGAGGTVYAAGGGGSGYINTSHSGYVSGSLTQGDGGDGTDQALSPAGSGVTKPSNGPGDATNGGGVIFKLN
tara:strand:+ start:261 stop:1307 length:1047 start_codon:yes stop_codon:yes gene_type:complete